MWLAQGGIITNWSAFVWPTTLCPFFKPKKSPMTLKSLTSPDIENRLLIATFSDFKRVETLHYNEIWIKYDPENYKKWEFILKDSKVILIRNIIIFNFNYFSRRLFRWNLAPLKMQQNECEFELINLKLELYFIVLLCPTSFWIVLALTEKRKENVNR